MENSGVLADKCVGTVWNDWAFLRILGLFSLKLMDAVFALLSVTAELFLS